MTTDRDDPEGLRRSSESVEAERLCRRVSDVLGPALTESYGLSPVVVYTFMQEAFDSYAVCRQSVADGELWLHLQILEKVHAYMKARGMKPPQPNRELHLLDVLRMQAVMATLAPNCRRALLLFYQGQMTYREIAEELDVSDRYARDLVSRGQNRLLEWIAAQKQEQE